MTTHVLAKSKEKLYSTQLKEIWDMYLIISFDKHCSFRNGRIYVSLFGSRKWLFWFFAFLDAKSSKQNNWWGSRNQKGRMVSWFWCPYGIGGKETKLLDWQVKFIYEWGCRKQGRGALCVEMGFTWTFPRNQDATVKLKSELISIKF